MYSIPMHMICVSICFIQQGHIKLIKIESIFHIIAVILSFIIHQIILGGGGVFITVFTKILISTTVFNLDNNNKCSNIHVCYLIWYMYILGE